MDSEINKKQSNSEPGCSYAVIMIGVIFLIIGLIAGTFSKCIGGEFHEGFSIAVDEGTAPYVFGAIVLVIFFIFRRIFKKK